MGPNHTEITHTHTAETLSTTSIHKMEFKSCWKTLCSHCYCNPLCLFSWIVVGLGASLAYHLHNCMCTVYRASVSDNWPLVFSWVTFAALLYPAASGVVFIFLSKCRPVPHCHCIIRFAWILIHGLLSMAGIVHAAYAYEPDTAIVIDNEHVHLEEAGTEKKAEQVYALLADSRRSSDNPRVLPDWWLKFQTRERCCGVVGVEDYGTRILPAELAASCSAWAANGIGGCASPLNKLFAWCQSTSVQYIIAMFCAGWIPYVIYLHSCHERKKQADEEKLEDDNADEDTDAPFDMDKFNAELERMSQKSEWSELDDTDKDDNSNPAAAEGAAATTSSSVEVERVEKYKNTNQNQNTV